MVSSSKSRDEVERALAVLVDDPIFQRLHTPEFRLEFGEDRNGEAAVWVYVLIADDAPPDLVRGPHFEELRKVREALQAAGWDGPVYTRFRLVSEDLSLRGPTVAK
jgi:hypothetical protein